MTKTGSNPFLPILLSLVFFLGTDLSWAQSQPTKTQNAHYDVVVIGGGISGLSTVEMLERKGIKNVLLLEKSDRVGGKMWTERSLESANGPYYERGAELVNTSDRELMELIKSLGLQVTERRFKSENRGEVFYFKDRQINKNGDIVDGKMTAFTYEQLIEKMHQFPQDISVLEGLFDLQENRRTAKGSSKAFFMNRIKRQTAMSPVSDGVYTKAFLEALMQSEFGLSLSQLNIEVLLDYLRIEKNTLDNGEVKYDLQIIPESDEKFRVTGGTDSIIQKLKAKFRSRITTNSAVQSVRQSSADEFKIDYSVNGRGKEVTTKHVVFAVPAYDLAKMHIDIPEIDQRKLHEAAALPYAENAKIFLIFDQKFWDHSFKSNPKAFAGVGVLEQGVQFWDTTENQRSHRGVITLYPGQWPTDPKDQQKRLNEILSELKKVPGLEALEAHLEKTDIQVWKKSYAGGFNPSYPRSPGIFAENLHANVSFVGADKDNNIRGEISASYGYMNGAVRTAIRAATRIFQKTHSAISSCKSIHSY